MADILADPAVVCRMGEILASYFYASNPSVVITMETMGIPVAMGDGAHTGRAAG